MKQKHDEDEFDGNKPGKRKHQQRLAALNMMHCKNLQKVQNDTTSLHRKYSRSTSKSSSDVKIASGKKNRYTGGGIVIAVSPMHDSSQIMDFNTPVSPSIATSPVTKRSIKRQLFESSALLRCDLMQEEEYINVKQNVPVLITFLQEITLLARERDVLEGALFQQILRNCSMAGVVSVNPMTPHRQQPISSVELKRTELQALVPKTENLVRLLRVKIGDDNDLNLARKALREISTMLEGVSKLAQATNTKEFDIVTKYLQ